MSDPSTIQGSCDVFNSVGQKYAGFSTGQIYTDSASALKAAIQNNEFSALPATIINDPTNQDALLKCFSDGFNSTKNAQQASFYADSKGQIGLIAGSITGLVIGIIVGKYILK